MSNITFAKLKKNAGLEKLAKAVQAGGSRGFEKDARYWEPTVDKVGNGFAVIRFLDAPAVDGDNATPWVTIFNHGFKGPGGQWYIENSLTTLGQPDPVSDMNQKLWNTGDKANQELVRDRKRKLNYISNILVVNDPAHPENNGKVFLYKYGKKIHDKILDKAGLLGESQEGETFRDPEDIVYNPMSLFEGGNFKLSIRKVDGFRNYDKSTFDLKPSPLFDGDDEKIEKLWKSEYSLKAEIAPDKFKSYDELKRKLERVLGIADTTPRASSVELPSHSELEVATKPTSTKKSKPASDPDDEFADFASLAE